MPREFRLLGCSRRYAGSRDVRGRRDRRGDEQRCRHRRHRLSGSAADRQGRAQRRSDPVEGGGEGDPLGGRSGRARDQPQPGGPARPARSAPGHIFAPRGRGDSLRREQAGPRRGRVVGNSDQAPRSPWNFAGYPAALPHVVGVSALDPSGNVPEFSDRDTNYNDISAPGTEIFSTLPLAMTAPTRTNGCPNQGYSECGPFEFRHAEGTSFAAPMVAGAAALILSMKPGLAPDQVYSILTRAADDVNASTGCRACPVRARQAQRLGPRSMSPMPPAWSPTAASSARMYASRTTMPGSSRRPSGGAPKARFNATTDYWNDPVDVYRIKLAKGQRISLVLNGPQGANSTLGALASRDEDRRRPFSGGTEETARSVGPLRPDGKISAFRARTGGWHYVSVQMTTKDSGAYSLQYRRS